MKYGRSKADAAVLTFAPVCNALHKLQFNISNGSRTVPGRVYYRFSLFQECSEAVLYSLQCKSILQHQSCLYRERPILQSSKYT